MNNGQWLSANESLFGEQPKLQRRPGCSFSKLKSQIQLYNFALHIKSTNCTQSDSKASLCPLQLTPTLLCPRLKLLSYNNKLFNLVKYRSLH